jgi:hypothetical protein
MRIATRLGLSLAAVVSLAAASSTSAAEAKCVEGNCWMICEDALNRCLAAGGEDCFERYQVCGLDCPM